MRIVTWNCGMALLRKAASLLALNPDIAVIQECSRKSVDDIRSHGLSGLWFGANPNKGVAVLCGKRWKPKAVDAPFGKWIIPVRIHGSVDFNLLAVWACRLLPVGMGDWARRTAHLHVQRGRIVCLRETLLLPASTFSPRRTRSSAPAAALLSSA